LEYIKQNVKNESGDFETRLRELISYAETPNPFDEKETKALIEGINNCKILDPACGSGAYPMGILHKMVHLLQKLDPENIHWKAVQRHKAMEETETAFEIGDKEERGKRLNEINDVFENNASDYGRKLYLIENCIYGIDIQPIAVQISKLRFFISLIIDQNKQEKKENFGIRSLPNLETKFVAANTLIGLDIPTNDLFAENNPVKKLENDLKIVRHEYFAASNRKEKLRLQKEDKKLRKQISELIKAQLIKKGDSEIVELRQIIDVEKANLKQLEKSKEDFEIIKSTDIFGGTTEKKIDKKAKKIKAQKDRLNHFEKELQIKELATNKDAIANVAQQIASFDPYDQNTFAPWFEPEWMFGLTTGFDIVIGNPPYGVVFDLSIKAIYEKRFPTFKRNNDIYVAFFESSIAHLNKNGFLCFITPNTYLNGDYFKLLRKLFRGKTKIREIVDFKNSKIFQDPTVFVSITSLQIANNIKLPYDSFIKISNEDFTQTEAKSFIISEINELPFKPANILIDKFTTGKSKNKFFLLDEKFFVKDVGFNYWSEGKGKKRDGDSIGDRILYSGVRKSKKDKSYLKGKDIEKFAYSEPNNYLRHDYQNYLQQGVDTFRYSADFLGVSPKIIYRQTSNRIIAAVDFEQNLCDKTVHIIVPKTDSESVLYLAGLLNSQLFEYFYKDISQELAGRTFAQVKTIYIKQLPIIIIEKGTKNIIENIVNYILEKKSFSQDTTFFERLLDAMVYELYLPEEIKGGGADVLKYLDNLPEIIEGQDEQNLKTIEKVYKELSDPKHPISAALLKLLTIEEVNIIEGRK
jgi:hypothetical protein